MTGSGYTYSSGSWIESNKEKGVILLKSTYQKDSFPLNVNESIIPVSGHFPIKLQPYYSQQKDTVIWMELLINDSILIGVDNETVELPNYINSVKTIQLIFYFNNLLHSDLRPVNKYTRSFKSSIYNVTNSSSTTFAISFTPIDVNLFYYKYFDNEQIVVTGEELKWIGNKNRVFEKQ